MYKIVSIEGNIGSGKTTLFNRLKKHFKNNDGIIFLREPIDDWNHFTDQEGNTMIQKFYNDQKSYAFSFQIMAFVSRLSILKEAIDKNKNIIIITERSLYTDKYVFAKMLHDQNKIEDINYKIYLNMFDQFSNEYSLSDIIYVKTNPSICLERIRKRAREGEENIIYDYLNECDKYHDDFITSKMNFPYSVHLIDGNLDIYDNPNIMDLWITNIEKILKVS